jgi:hypothetical protein
MEENKEMKRLRQKRSLFFNHYEVDSVCTPEGVLSIPVDDGGESAPKHLIDVFKNCLQTVYDEGHIDETPTWRQVEQCNNGTPDKICFSDCIMGFVIIVTTHAI